MKKLIISLLVILSILSCQSIRNNLTFYPDTKTVIDSSQLPEYISPRKITTTDNEEIDCLLFQNSQQKKKNLIIYFHGNAGNLYHRLGYADNFFKMNHDVLLISYRGYAKSSGEPSEKGIYIDGKSAINYAIKKLGYSIKNISIIGRSLGTTVAVHNAQNEKFKSVILITPLTSGKAMAAAMGLGAMKSIASDSFESINKIQNLKSPLLIMDAEDDNVTPVYMGKELYVKYNGSKKRVTIKKAGHNNLQEVNPKLFWDTINSFLNQ